MGVGQAHARDTVHMASGVNGSACAGTASITWEVMVTGHNGPVGMRLASSNNSLLGVWYVLDVSVGKGYTYSLLPENFIVRGKNYAEHT
jgi:hypothetical protein